MSALLIYLVPVAAALTPQEAFPATRADDAQVRATLAKLQGPPARVYDPVTASPGLATPFEAELEQALFPKLRPAPDTLRRYGDLMVELYALGQVSAPVEGFVAEHVGLPTDPVILGTFVSSGTDAKGLAALMKGYGDVEGLATAVAVTAPVEGGVRGLLLGLQDVVSFERFPRVWAPGDTPSIPGVLLSKGKRYSLYVADASPEVQELELPGKDGVFEIAVPVPEEPGPLRIAMSERGRRGLPDTNFFFSLYMGVEPPLAPEELPAATEGASPEDSLLAALNVERARHGQAPLVRAGDTAAGEAWLTALPEREMARARAFKTLAQQDLLADRPHGGWSGMVLDSDHVLETAWIARTHPYYRGGLLDPQSRFAVVAGTAAPRPPPRRALFYEDVPSVAELRPMLQERLSARFTKPPRVGEALQPRLDALAERIATGDTSMNAGMRELQKVVEAAMRDKGIEGAAAMNIFVWSPGEEPDLSQFNPGPTLRAVAVGIARGTLGKGSMQAAVGVVVSAEAIK